MKPVKSCLFLLAVLFSALVMNAQTAAAPSADEIIAKHIEAIGGKEKLNGLNSMRIESELDVMGNSAPTKVIVLNGKGYRNESDFDGQKVIQVYTDKSGWAVNAFMGINEPQAMPEEQYKAGQDQIYVVPLLGYADRGTKAELLGQEKLGEVNAYKVKLTNKNNFAATYYFDPTTYHILQSVTTTDFGGQMVDLKVIYSDYKKTDYGWVIPHNTVMDFGGQFSMTSKVNKIEFNAAIDNSVFEMKN